MSTSLLLLLSSAWATEPAPAPKNIEVSGMYSIWVLTQRNFMLGDEAQVLDDSGYVVQNLRTQVKFNQEHYGVVARFDAAQGWWGADESPDTEQVTTVGEDGTVSTTQTYNPYKLFRDKDTNYDVHFDIAYAWVDLPGVPFPVKVKVGRQLAQTGHGLVLEQDSDGVQVVVQPIKPLALDLGWSKMSEGYGSTRAPTGGLLNDEGIYADADLFFGRLRFEPDEAHKAELYGAYYSDRSGDGTATFAPNGLGYYEARFRPNVSSALAIGASTDGKAELLGGLTWAAEGAWLTGQDKVQNQDSAGGLLDQNNGQLKGWVAYAQVDQSFALAWPVSVGAALGAGSGDTDKASGTGNINKIMTMGTFQYTNVWEDSVMPDQEGIGPQGLGSPVSRGYREFENTLAAQGRLGLQPHERFKLLATYTWLHAVTPIQGWDSAGALTDQSSADIGQEIDLNLDWNVWKGFSYQAQCGLFLPGDGAGFLILGQADALAPAWEIKQVVSAKF